jgi:uncharacterized protein
MTPEERKLVTDLFDRLASLEDNPRDPNAVDAINEGLERAPNAVYALVQTVLVQDEALKRADARIRALEGGAGEAPRQDTSFLGGLRNQILGRREETRGGSVPSVRPGAPSSAWHNTGAPATPQPMQAQAAPEPMQQRGGMGGSFLGTAAAAAAGVVGGSLLMGGIRSMMGGGGQSHSAFDSGGGRDAAPWGGGGSGGELSRQAGLEDMGRSPRGQQAYDDGDRSGASDASGGEQSEQEFGGDGDLETDDGGGFGGGSDD